MMRLKLPVRKVPDPGLPIGGRGVHMVERGGANFGRQKLHPSYPAGRDGKQKFKGTPSNFQGEGVAP